MHKTEALRSIYFDQLEYIQQKVWVDFDNRRQQPVSFTFAGQTHQIDEIVGRYKMLADQPSNGYLVEATDQNVFYLYSQLENIDRRHTLEKSFWVLSFRIKSDDELMSFYLEDRKMLVNPTLKRVADFHGHICPELALGGKFCEFVQDLLATEAITTPDLAIVAENSTSALDAIQILLGATIGNQKLMVMDYGKHNYSLFSRHYDKGWKISLKPQYYEDEETFHDLEGKIANDQALLEDMVRFQQLLDSRVGLILDTSPEELFAIEEVDAKTRPQESVSVYLTCSVCGEQVLSSRSVENRDLTYCLPCFQKKNPSCTQFAVQ